MTEAPVPDAIALPEPVLHHRAALRVVEGALAHAESEGLAVCVSVVDRAGRVVASTRMPGAFLVSDDLSRQKAWSAVAIGVDPDVLDGIFDAEHPRVRDGIVRDGFTMVRGGLVLRGGDQVVGAVGVSGGSEAQDVACAEAAVAALRSAHQRVE